MKTLMYALLILMYTALFSFILKTQLMSVSNVTVTDNEIATAALIITPTTYLVFLFILLKDLRTHLKRKDR